MKNFCIALATATLCVSLFGCSMCCGPYDYDYPTYGGKIQRTDPAYGRVGSIFSDPATVVRGPNADSNLSEPDPEQRREDGLENLEDLDNLLEEDLDNFDQQNETLPNPDVSPQPESDGTAFQNWRQRPMRRGQHWR